MISEDLFKVSRILLNDFDDVVLCQIIDRGYTSREFLLLTENLHRGFFFKNMFQNDFKLFDIMRVSFVKIITLFSMIYSVVTGKLKIVL